MGAANRMAPYAKNAAIPFALGELSSLMDNVVESIFAAGILNGNMSHPSDDKWNMCVEYVSSREQTTGGWCKNIEGWKDSQDDRNSSKNTRSAKVDNKTEDGGVEVRSAKFEQSR